MFFYYRYHHHHHFGSIVSKRSRFIIIDGRVVGRQFDDDDGAGERGNRNW